MKSSIETNSPIVHPLEIERGVLVWVVIAAYNEAEVIGNVISELMNVFKHIVVVDDCSQDNTADIVVATGTVVLRHCINLGQGAALQTGIDFALAQGADVIVTFDADGQHRPIDAQNAVNTVVDKQIDVVCGSRFLGINAVGMPVSRCFALRLVALMTRFLTGLKVTDAHNGLRALSRNAAQKIKIKHNRMAHASEIIFLIRHLELSYTEIPVEIQYSSYSREKGQRLLGGFRILYDLFLGG